MRNLFLFLSIGTISTIALSSSIGSGLNRSTLNQCVNNNDNSACSYLINSDNASNYQKVTAKKILLIRGL